MPTSPTAESDQPTIAAQLGRSLRALSQVMARCPLGLPVVIAVPPLLDDGTPFPTRYWLTCPLAVKRLARIESAGEIKALEAKLAADPQLARALDEAHARYSRQRDLLVSPEAKLRPRGGVGGAVGGIKCLHAHYADHAAGNRNPVGELVAPRVEPLDCVIPCVLDGTANPTWREPR